MTGLPAIEEPFEYEGLSVVPFVNKFADRGIETVDMLGLCRTAPLFAERIVTQVRLLSYVQMDRFIEDHILPGFTTYSEDSLHNLEMSMRESISNYIRHTEEGGLYRPVVDLDIVHGTTDIGVLTIRNEDPNFDPRICKWQLIPEQSKLLDFSGRGAMFLRIYADFAAHARKAEEPWMQYVAVQLS